jgi:Mannitol-1-phosphate/altronate dehydrogenases
MKQAVMYGAGNIGRGFIGQLFFESGYETTFIDVNMQIIDRLNKDHEYPLKLVSSDGVEDVIVKKVKGVDGRDINAVANAIASADVFATAVGVNILPFIVSPLVAGFRKRWEMGNFVPLNIIICENLIDANRYLEKLIKETLTDEEKSTFDKTIGLVEASIGRMVPAVSPEMQNGNILTACAEPFKELPVDKDAIIGETPEIVAMIPSTPFEYHIQKKLFLHNLGHATTAYFGYLKQYAYIYEAIDDQEIFHLAKKAMSESSLALSKEHGIAFSEIEKSRDNLLDRFSNTRLKDTIERVGKDPIRKLSDNDRLVGAALLCQKHEISSKYIAIAIAAGFLFAPDSDENAQKVQASIQNDGIKKAICMYTHLDESNALVGDIMKYYEMLKENTDLTQF